MLTCFSLLENLDLRMTGISLDLIWSIHTLPMLVSLDLTGAFQGSARDLLNFTSNLKILNLCNSAVSNQELECIADKFPFIEEISLKYCQKIKLTRRRAILSGNHNRKLKSACWTLTMANRIFRNVTGVQQKVTTL